MSLATGQRLQKLRQKLADYSTKKMKDAGGVDEARVAEIKNKRDQEAGTLGQLAIEMDGAQARLDEIRKERDRYTTSLGELAQGSNARTVAEVAEAKNRAEQEEKKQEESIFSDYMTWADAYIKRRLTLWKNFFLLQVHVLVDGAVDENLLRSIGSTITRDSKDASMPGFQIVRPNSADEEKAWREWIRSLDCLPSSMHIHDLADVDEAFAVFRLPYRPDAGLPGANFISAVKEPPKPLG